MENLSLVIKSDSEQIYKYIKEFSPLIDDYSTEIIIINNEEVRLNLQYKYVVYKFEETYDKFYDFCYSVCTRDNIIIVEDGMCFDNYILNQVKSIISSRETNIDCSLKQFINKDKYIIRNYRINNNRVSDNSEVIDFAIEDTSLLQYSSESIDKALNILCSQKKFSEIYTYYNEVILNGGEEFKNIFYVILEKKKLELSVDAVELVELGFINSDDDSNYSKYLAVKFRFENADGNYEELLSNIKNINLSEEDIYFSFFLLKVFRKKVLVGEICKVIDSKPLYKYVKYLFNNVKDFYLLAYDYLLSINLSKEIALKENKNIEIYSYLCKWYIELMSEKSDSIEDKQKLIQVFIDYTNYGFYLINQHDRQRRKLVLNNEIKFLQEVDKAISLINENKIENAIKDLKKAVSNYKLMSRPVEYYIQRLRFENRQYPYKISICMIVKDEEKNIERCLNSLMPLVNSKMAELIIVDTGSSDKTVELARKYVKEVYFHKWQGNFSEARNYSISLAQGEYIFIMDADEEIEGEELAKIADAFKSDSYREYNTFSFKIKNYSDESYKKFSVFTQNLIFKNDGTFYYSGSVHNQPVYKLPIKNIDCTILHYGYIMTEDIKDKKFIRTSTLLKKELEKNPKNIYYRFQLSVSYSMHGDLQESLEQAKIYMKLLKEKKDAVKDNLMYYNNAALVYTNNRLFEEAIEISNEALAIQPDFIDFIYYKGDGYFELKEYEKSIAYLKEYLKLIDEFHMHRVMQDDRYLFYTLDSKETAKGLITVAYSKVDKYEECINSNKAIKDAKIFRNTLYSVIDSYFKLDDAEGIVEFYKENIYSNTESDLREVFKYYFEENLLSMPEEKQKKYILAFVQSELDDDYVDILRFSAGKNIVQNADRVLSFIDKYDINESDTISGNMIIETVFPILNSYTLDSNSNLMHVKNLKRSAEFVLHRSLNLQQYNLLRKEELLSILDKYITFCTYLFNMNQKNLLDITEQKFISNVLMAFEQLNQNNFIKCIEYIRDSVIENKKMAKPMELFLETIIPGYNVDENNGKKKEEEKTLRNLIKKLIEEQNIEEAFEVLQKLETVTVIDAEIYSMKVVILIMAGLLSEAEEVLQEALKKYPYNPDLLFNYSYLCDDNGIKGKAVELYSLGKMSNIGTQAKINDIMPNYVQAANSEIRILSGTIEIANQMNTITKGLQSLGVNARNLNYYPNYLQYSSDMVMDIKSFGSFGNANEKTREFASKIINDFDIFHFQFGTSLTLDNLDMPVLKELSKKIVMQHHGSDIRMFSKAVALNPFAKVKDMNEDAIKRKLSYLSRYADCCIVGDYELYEYVKEYYSNVKIVPIMIDTNEFSVSPVSSRKNDEIVIVHAPTSPEYKGTKYITQAINELKVDFPNINYKLVQGLSHSEALKIYQQADIIIDQILTGSYGVFAIESMAMGKPVVCWISDFMKDKYPKELPIVSANPNTIKSQLEYLIKNRDMLNAIGNESRKYVENYHSMFKYCSKLLQVYKSL